eukprot:Partr_v1_DN27773_c2_g1_i1_m66806 putative nitrogen regulatory protein
MTSTGSVAPIILKIKGNTAFTQTASLDNEEELSKTWKICTKVKDSIENGCRLENLSWRLWHLHKRIVDDKCKVQRISSTATRRLKLDGSAGSSSGTNTSTSSTTISGPSGNDHMLPFLRESSKLQVTTDDCLESTILSNTHNNNNNNTINNLNTADPSKADIVNDPITDTPAHLVTEHSVLFDDFFGAAGATAILGNVDTGPLLKIPAEKFLDWSEVQFPDVNNWESPSLQAPVPNNSLNVSSSMIAASSSTTSCPAGHQGSACDDSSNILDASNRSHSWHNLGSLLPFYDVPNGSANAAGGYDDMIASNPMQPFWAHPMDNTDLQQHVHMAPISVSFTPTDSFSTTVSSTSLSTSSTSGSSVQQHAPLALFISNSHDSTTHAGRAQFCISPDALASKNNTGYHKQPVAQTSRSANNTVTTDDMLNQRCENCHVRNTPLWRKCEDGTVLCNACGLYFKLHREHRPQSRIAVQKVADETPMISCANCATRNTPLWRRHEGGYTLCNACGLYRKMHGSDRPLSLKTDVIKKRQRADETVRPKSSKKSRNSVDS